MKREYPTIKSVDLDTFTATQIANSVPWDGEYVRADDLEKFFTELKLILNEVGFQLSRTASSQ